MIKKASDENQEMGLETGPLSLDLRPDIYIGLVGAVGTDLTGVRSALQAQLAVVGYKVEHIKVSSLLGEVLDIEKKHHEKDRIKTLMLAGDCIRTASEEGDGVAALVISEIRRRRSGKPLSGSAAFIIDSLKNPAEVDLFNEVYVRNYYTVSVYLSREERLRNLSIKIARDMNEPAHKKHEALAAELVRDDEKGDGKRSQNVQDTFPKADYFVNGRKPLEAQVKRFVDLVFGEPFSTPTKDEYNMFLARAAGYRSADLSRQVGAVIVDTHGSISGTGCNEVPYPGGGIFDQQRDAGLTDNRDYTKQVDPNYAEIQRSLIEFVRILRGAGYIDTTKHQGDVDVVLVDELLQGHQKELMSNARIRNLIEFGRIVHAEMHALCQAAASGSSVRGGALYCTTFPCHGCARHIIAAGIHEVVYIEPYPKSLSSQLYSDEILFAHEEPESHSCACPPKQVIFRPFHGISPTLFQRVFKYRTRKDRRGNVVTWVPEEAVPQGVAQAVERPELEASAANSVAAFLDAAKVQFEARSGETFDGDSHASRAD